MDTILWQRLSAQAIRIDQSNHQLEIDQDQVERFFLPIARWLDDARAQSSRLMVAVAGAPGAGKSAFCAVLAAVINAWKGNDRAVVVGQDGWHFPNAYLNRQTIENDGRLVSLRSLKGMPESFDVTGMQSALQQMKSGLVLRFPVYSRVKHDPLPDFGLVSRNHRIVIVEGNYVLLTLQPWSALLPLFDKTIMISASLEQILQNLRGRHAQGSRDPADTERHIASVDLPDIKLISSASIQPNLLIEKEDSFRIASLHLNKKTEGGSPSSVTTYPPEPGTG